MWDQKRKGNRPKPVPPTIVLMSLRLVIPWRVALQQSPPPLHQPRTIMMEQKRFEQEKSLNGKVFIYRLSQPRGSPQCRVRTLANTVNERPGVARSGDVARKSAYATNVREPYGRITSGV